MKIAEKHDLKAHLSELMDESLPDTNAIEAKAREIVDAAKEADREGTETFDSGQTGVVTRNVDDMSGMEKVLHALNHPPKTNK